LFRRAFQRQRSGDLAGAVTGYREVVELAPKHIDARYLLGTVLAMLGDLEAAVANLEAAALLAPDSPMIRANLGLVFKMQGRNDDAESAFRQALAIDPNLPQASNNLASLLIQRGRPAEAEHFARQTLAADPSATYACVQLANAQADQGRIEAAVDSLRQMLEVSPDSRIGWGNFLSFLHSDPRCSKEELRRLHSHWGERHPAAGQGPVPAAHERIRVGYLSPDLAEHSVGFLLEPVVAAHDTEAFEIVLYHDRAGEDRLGARLKALAGVRWTPVSGMSDAELAARIRADDLDILVDLAGHLSGNRLPALAQRLAPIQATWLGYPGSTGLPAMDYAISDHDLDPPSEGNAWYSESLFRLDRPAYCFAPPEAAGEIGSPGDGGFRFGAFNSFRKLNDDVIADWAAVLRRVPGSALVLQARGLSEAAVQERCVERFGRHGIGRERLELHPAMPLPEHLQLVSSCHLCLDTWPWTGHMTTLNCLWMGVPTLTLAGDRRASRMGAGIFGQLELEQFVTHSRPDYVAAAVKIAADTGGLAALRSTLRERLSASPLMDGRGMAEALEQAYRAMRAAKQTTGGAAWKTRADSGLPQ
jgi:predicted O-linked N-acetylglucosamine transferase (SPINDLY family)